MYKKPIYRYLIYILSLPFRQRVQFTKLCINMSTPAKNFNSFKLRLTGCSADSVQNESRQFNTSFYDKNLVMATPRSLDMPLRQFRQFIFESFSNNFLKSFIFFLLLYRSGAYFFLITSGIVPNFHVRSSNNFRLCFIQIFLSSFLFLIVWKRFV